MLRITRYVFGLTLLACTPLRPMDGSIEDQDKDGFTVDVDCNDDDASIFPGAPEACTLPLVDSNCDGQVGGGDADQDGVRACDDCDDDNAQVYPEAHEICDQIDNDCDGLVDDEDDSLAERSATTWFYDSDQDGWGGSLVFLRSCEAAEGYVDNDLDCDDDNDAIHPGATEVCDFIDNDCDELIDAEDEVIPGDEDPICYVDDDEDGYGDIEDSGLHTCSCGEGETSVPGDCDDKARNVHPDADFFDYPTVDGDFDYNCDGVEECSFEVQGVCELDSTGKGCTFTSGWVNGTPECGKVSGVFVSCTYNDTKGTRPVTGTGGGSTGGTTTSTPTCDPEYINMLASCR